MFIVMAVSIQVDRVSPWIWLFLKKQDGPSVGQIQVVDISIEGGLAPAGQISGRDSDKFGVSVAASYDGKLVYGGASAANLVRIYADLY